jgi:hypothetical protein
MIFLDYQIPQTVSIEAKFSFRYPLIDVFDIAEGPKKEL